MIGHRVIFLLIILQACQMNISPNNTQDNEQKLNYFDHLLQGENVSGDQLRQILAGEWEFFTPPERSKDTSVDDSFVGKITVAETLPIADLAGRISIIMERSGITAGGIAFTTTMQLIFENQQLVVDSLQPGELTVGKMQGRRILIKVKNADGATAESLYDFSVDGEITLSYRKQIPNAEAVEQTYLYAKKIE